MYKPKKTYRFALRSSLMISVVATLFMAGVLYLNHVVTFGYAMGFFALLFVVCFIVIQYRAETVIYRRVEMIYDELSKMGLEVDQFIGHRTDMKTLSQEVKKFASHKKHEIDELQSLEAYRREFFGNVSHELKTPLFTVQGYLSTLLDGAMNDKAVRKKYLERAENGVERLVHIVEELDMIAQLERSDRILTVETFNLVPLVQNVLDMLEIEANKKDILLTMDMKYTRPIEVVADRKKMEQVFINLINNSIKYGKEKGNTEISIDTSDPERVIVKVMDDGPGIPPQYLSRVFERFFRIDKSGSRDAGGSGLGLAIVKHVIDAHGEKVSVSSKPGKGATFSFGIKKSDSYYA